MSTVTPEEFDFSELDFGKSPEALDLFDSVEETYFDSCAKYAAWPHDNNLKVIHEATSEYVKGYSGIIKSVFEDTSVDELAKITSRILVKTDHRRAKSLNEIAGKEILEPMQDKFEFFEQPDDQDEETIHDKKLRLIQAGEEWNTKFIYQDTQEFVTTVLSGPNAKKVEQHEKLKSHVIDIGKIALGTWAALVISKKFGRD